MQFSLAGCTSRIDKAAVSPFTPAEPRTSLFYFLFFFYDNPFKCLGMSAGEMTIIRFITHYWWLWQCGLSGARKWSDTQACGAAALPLPGGTTTDKELVDKPPSPRKDLPEFVSIWAICSSGRCQWYRVGAGWSLTSLPTQAILWFYDN